MKYLFIVVGKGDCEVMYSEAVRELGGHSERLQGLQVREHD